MRSCGSRKGRAASNKTPRGQRHCILLSTRQRSHPTTPPAPHWGRFPQTDLLQIYKLRHREGETFAQGHAGCELFGKVLLQCAM